LFPVLWVRILSSPLFRIRGIRKFLDLQDPLVRDTDPDPSMIKQNSKKTLYLLCFVPLWLLSLKNGVNVPSKSKNT
jgi:hypothetical protein